jgi:hypothetical protein
LLGGALFLLAGCGGPPQAQPTAIPANVVRPVQPTPQYPEGADVFSLLTPQASPQFVATPAGEDALAVADGAGSGMRAAIELFIKNQTPSAVGIAPGGAAIYAARGGRILAAVPVGGILTVTGKSPDGAWYAVYNDAAVYGWTPAGQLRVYGDDDLIVVEEAPDPAPVATLLAQTDAPVRVLDDLMAQFDATATSVAQAAAAEPTPAPTPTPTLTPTTAPVNRSTAEASVPSAAADSQLPAVPADMETQLETGVVSSEGRLNLRTEPNTDASIATKLDPGTPVTVLARTNDGAWLQVQLADGTEGWVAAEYVTLDR